MKTQEIFPHSLINIDPIQKDLENVNNFLQHQFTLIDVPLIQEIATYMIGSGGKRLRPLLTLYAARILKYEKEQHIPLAAAIECIHIATLLHDDVVDDAIDRRGHPSANVKWGNRSSILAGDFLFTQSFNIIVQQQNLLILEVISKAAATIASGEVLQLVHGHDMNLNSQTYFQIITGKTAALFQAACTVGSLLSHHVKSYSTYFSDFGEKLGIAFQLKDDLNDYALPTSGQDFQDRKMTLPLIYLYESFKKEGQGFKFEEAFKDRNYFFIQKQLEERGVINQIQQLAEKYLKHALKSLHKLPEEDICLSSLKGLIDLAKRSI